MNNETEPVIQVEDLTAGYGDEVILDGISFDVYPGEVLVIAGGSGCGKTTLLKNMIGLLKPDAGRILIDDNDIVTASGRSRHRILRTIGVRFDSAGMLASAVCIYPVDADRLVKPIYDLQCGGLI